MITEKWMFALKLFLPSWNFFNDFGEVPRLEYQVVGEGADSVDWRPVFSRYWTGRVGRMLFNPVGNLELLEQSIVSRAVDELDSGTAGACSAFTTSETHTMLERLVRGKIAERFSAAGPDRFRFRLVTVEPGAEPKVVFSSDEFPIKEPAL